MIRHYISFYIVISIFIIGFHPLFSYHSTLNVARFNSENNDYYAEVIKTGGAVNSIEGQIKVYQINTKEPLYTIYLAPSDENLFISNDGQNVLIYDMFEEEIYKYYKGNLEKKITRCELVPGDVDSELSFKFRNNELYEKDSLGRWMIDSTYKNRRVFKYKAEVDDDLKFIDLNSMFSYKDTVYFITTDLQVIIIPINELNYSIIPFSRIKDKLKTIANYKPIFCEKVNYEKDFPDFPKLKDGQELYQVLGKKFPFLFYKLDEYEDPFDDRLTEDSIPIASYAVSIKGYLTHDGKYHVENIKYDSIIPHKEIVDFFNTQLFEKVNFPEVLDRWKFSTYLEYRNLDIEKSKIEWVTKDSIKKIETEKRKKADTLWGVYIPKDLDDSFKQLDSILPNKTVKLIDTLQNETGMNQYHHGLGTWLRNNWALWAGSRLSLYFNDLGIFHPDDMSGIILDSYYRYRHKLPINLDEQIKYYQDYWKKVKKE